MAEIGNAISGFLGDTVMEGIQAILYATIYKLLYYIAVGCCWFIDLVYGMFEVMSGLTKVRYNGDTEYLINVFFSNGTVTNIYWGMALIGMTVGFGFAIAAVIKKLFDTNEKEKRSYSQILSGLFKTILIILCMSLIISGVLNATTLLMQQINYVFINADALDQDESITTTDEEFATMARIFNTIGNFSLNPSYNNRLNLNKCFNEIRPDLLYLMQQGVFDFYYVTTDTDGNNIATWQSALQKIANSASLNRDLSLDVYNESVSNAILEAMELLKVNGSFKPLAYYERQYKPSRASLPLDRLLFLMATMRAAKNNDHNRNPNLTDPLRGAYYYGEKSIYDLDAVNEDFDIGIAAFDYLILLLICFKMLQTLVTMILNCVGRIFNMLLLYLIAPLILAVSPLDDGAKFKQWTTAFVVQSLSVFGTVISMRVLLLFMPLVTDTALQLFENPLANLLGKLVIILGGFEVAEKATNLITGILADNAGWQSITAGDMSGSAAKITAMGKSAATQGLKFGGKALGGTAMAGAYAVGAAGLAAGYTAYGVGRGTFELGKAAANKISAWRQQRAGGEGGKNDGGNGGNPGNPGNGNAGGGGNGQAGGNAGENIPNADRQVGGGGDNLGGGNLGGGNLGGGNLGGDNLGGVGYGGVGIDNAAGGDNLNEPGPGVGNNGAAGVGGGQNANGNDALRQENRQGGFEIQRGDGQAIPNQQRQVGNNQNGRVIRGAAQPQNQNYTGEVRQRTGTVAAARLQMDQGAGNGGVGADPIARPRAQSMVRPPKQPPASLRQNGG